jgi:phosphoserine phosphatase
MKKLIILDFDHTIINTTYLTKSIAKKLQADFGISKEDYMAARKAVQKCCVVEDIDNVIQRLPHENKKDLHDAFHDIIKSEVHKFVFPDVVDFINRHKDNFDILISTHGDKELQNEKIKHSNLPGCIMQTIEAKNKGDVLAPYVDKYDKIYFIDDKAENIDAVKQKHSNVIAYFLKRPEDCKYCSIKSKCDCADKIVADLKFTIE